MDVTQSLARQLDTSWRLLDLHLTGLDDPEALWRPAALGPHVHMQSDGRWTADWPEDESYAAGPPSIAWVTWHIGFWWSMVQNQSFGDATLRREDVTWPGSTDAVRAWLADLHDAWVRLVAELSDDDFQSTDRTRWPMHDRPFGDVVAWVNVELMKNAAEIGSARFLYAATRIGTVDSSS